MAFILGAVWVYVFVNLKWQPSHNGKHIQMLLLVRLFLFFKCGWILNVEQL